MTVLKETRGRVSGPNGAATRLGMKRSTLLDRMKKLGIDAREVKSDSYIHRSEQCFNLYLTGRWSQAYETNPPWALDDFLAMISHELRIPISAILGWAELLDNQHVNHTDFATAIQVIRRTLWYR